MNTGFNPLGVITNPLTGIFLTGILDSVTDSLTGMEVAPVAVDPFASEDVELNIGEVAEVEIIPTEAVTVEVAGEIGDFAVEVSDETAVGVGNVVGVEVDPTGTPEVRVLGVEVTELTDPFAVGTFAVLGGLLGLL